jgi:hypothetical protein
MKKILKYFVLILLWWCFGSLLSVPIVRLTPEKYIFTEKFLVNISSQLYMMIIMIPFAISNMVSAFIVGIIAQYILPNEYYWKSGILLFLGSTVYVLLSSYEDKPVYLIVKIFIMGSLVFVFGYIGALVGNNIKQRMTNTIS